MGRRLKYKPGSFYRVSDRSGFVERAEGTRFEWNGLLVKDSEWEIRQPQDFVKGVKDDQSVPKPRPLAPNVFLGPLYFTVASAVSPTGSYILLTTESGNDLTTENDVDIVDDEANILVLNATAGISPGDPGSIILDDGTNFQFTFVNVYTNDVVSISASPPYYASIGNSVIDLATHFPPLPYGNLSK